MIHLSISSSTSPTNNALEQQLRPKVIMRKITFGNRLALGASNHESDDEHNPDWHLEWH